MSTSLTSKIKEFNELDVSSIIRESFGEASLIKAKPILEDIADKLTTIDKYQNNVDKESNSKVDGVMQQLLNLLKSIKNLPKEQFVNSQDSHYAQIISFHNEIIKYWPSYVTAARVSNGFLDALALQHEFIKSAIEATATRDDLIKTFKEKGNEIILAAEEKAKEIKQSARQVAQKISIKEAQDQFEMACNHHLKQITKWSCFSIFIGSAFIGILIWLLTINVSETWSWNIIYHTLVRLALLSLLGVILGFSLKMLKAYMHMYQHNLHRRYVANSMAAFVESATTPEQRDLILTTLVSSISTFGQSGIIDGQEDGTSKITVDTITRSIGLPGNG